jgi:hypothetical protein
MRHVTRFVSVVYFTMAVVGCVFDSSGLLRRDGGLAGDDAFRVDRAPPGDQTPPDGFEIPEDTGPGVDQTQQDKGPPCAGQTCSLSCNTAAGRCNRIKPSTFSVSELEFNQAQASPVLVSQQNVINTDTGEVTTGTAVLRPAGQPGTTAGGIHWKLADQGPGPKLSVFIVGALTIQAGATLEVIGGHPFTLYAKGDVKVDGSIVASGVGLAAGPGGGQGGVSNGADGAICGGGEGKGGGKQCAPGCTWHYTAGGSGGGNGGAGGAGGGNISVPGPAGGKAVNNPALLPLAGGCGGGAGGGPNGNDPNRPGGYGGGGGGAIQIVANGALSVTGQILAQGAGGGPGISGSAGGGGGAGGSVLLEAITLSTSGTSFIAANGGGGGSGGTDWSNGQPGQPGQASRNRANGGMGTLYGGGGGMGGAAAGANGMGGLPLDNGGGGGGAVGRIRFNAKAAQLAPLRTSPDHSTSVGNVAVW